tara:strand:+ start:601 stop:720 length:120 start_codon:yes stop_codon:yes gene_type:complete
MISTTTTVEEYVPGNKESKGIIKTTEVTIELPEKEESSE